MNASYQCRKCGGELFPHSDGKMGICDSCGSVMPLPAVSNESFNRANFLRVKGDFKQAQALFEEALSHHPRDGELYWNIVLCRFGIEYVEDYDKTLVPTCHFMRADSILEDADYLAALDYADGASRRVYLAEAERIDTIQKEMLALTVNQPKVDVFICYKESDESGERTADSILAQDIYQTLTNRGLKVFYARRSLQAGTEYEPYIYTALRSAGVMLVVATREEFVNSTWVRNEWSRFLEFMKDGRKDIVVVTKNLSEHDLPIELMYANKLDASQEGFTQELCDGVDKILRIDRFGQVQISSEDILAGLGEKEAALLKAGEALRAGDFDLAMDHYVRVLKLDEENGEAWWGMLTASTKNFTRTRLADKSHFIEAEIECYQSALKYSGEAAGRLYKQKVEEYAECYNKFAYAEFKERFYAQWDNGRALAGSFGEIIGNGRSALRFASDEEKAALQKDVNDYAARHKDYLAYLKESKDPSAIVGKSFEKNHLWRQTILSFRSMVTEKKQTLTNYKEIFYADVLPVQLCAVILSFLCYAMEDTYNGFVLTGPFGLASCATSVVLVLYMLMRRALLSRNDLMPGRLRHRMTPRFIVLGVSVIGGIIAGVLLFNNFFAEDGFSFVVHIFAIVIAVVYHWIIFVCFLISFSRRRKYFKLSDEISDFIENDIFRTYREIIDDYHQSHESAFGKQNIINYQAMPEYKALFDTLGIGA